MTDRPRRQLNPSELFDVCLTAYRACQAQMNGRPNTTRLEVVSTAYRRTYGNSAAEYCADFRRTAEETIERQPSKKGRLRLWQFYFVENLTWKAAIARTGVSPSTFGYWAQEIAWSVGRELRRRKIRPPNGLFYWLIQSEEADAQTEKFAAGAKP